MDKPTDTLSLPDSEAFRILAQSPISMVLSDPTLPDCPIVYVNRSFERVTGYSASASIGRNCRFLQGEATDPDDVRRIRRAIETETETTVDIVNYRADGTRFLNRLLLTPIYDRNGDLRYFLGIQKRLTDSEARNSVNVTQHAMRELKHRVKNHLAMVVSMIRLEGRERGLASDVTSLARRVESLQLLYEELSDPETPRNRETVSLGAYVSRLVNTTAHLDGRAGIRVNIDVGEAACGSETAAKLGLVISEVLTNAFQHAFEGREEGALDVHLSQAADGRVTVIVRDDGVGLPGPEAWPDRSSVGGRIVAGLIDDLDGELDVTTGAKGTTIRLTIPCHDDSQEP